MFRFNGVFLAFGLFCGGVGASSPTSDEVAAATAAENCRPVASLESHAIELARQLVLSNRQIKADSPVAVTSLVGLEDLRAVGDEASDPEQRLRVEEFLQRFA